MSFSIVLISTKILWHYVINVCDEATQEDLNRLLIVFQTERLMLVSELRPEAGLMTFIRGFNEPPLTVFLADAGHGAASPVKSVSAEETYPWTRFVNLSGYKEELVDWPAVERKERGTIRFIPELVHNLASALALRAPLD